MFGKKRRDGQEDRSPVFYELVFVDNDELLEALPQQLLESGLRWYWESEREWSFAVAVDMPELPAKRKLTPLTSDNGYDLVNDFLEQDVGGDARYVLMVGVDPGVEPSTLIHPIGMRSALTAFSRGELSPIQMVVVQVKDIEPALVYVSSKPSEGIERLLNAWAVTSWRPVAKRRYEKSPFKLEELSIDP